MNEKEFWLTMNEAIRRSDGAHIRTAFRQHPEMLNYERGGTWLHTAVKSNKLDVIRLLVELGCSIDQKDESFGQTPLGLAVGRDHPETVRALLEAGANPNLTGTYYPITALHLSMERGLEIITLLGDFGGDLCREYDHPLKKSTPLQWALSSKMDDVVEFLVAHGCPMPEGEEKAEDSYESGRRASEIGDGKWGSALLRSVAKGADIEVSESLRFGRPADEGQLNLLENNLGGPLTKELRELLLEFNGVWTDDGDSREPRFLSTDEMERAAHFYDDWDSELVLKVFPKVAFVCQKNGFSELWGVVIKPFKPFKRGDSAELSGVHLAPARHSHGSPRRLRGRRYGVRSIGGGHDHSEVAPRIVSGGEGGGGKAGLRRSRES